MSEADSLQGAHWLETVTTITWASDAESREFDISLSLWNVEGDFDGASLTTAQVLKVDGNAATIGLTCTVTILKWTSVA